LGFDQKARQEKWKTNPSRQCSSPPAGFGVGFLSEKQCKNMGASSIYSWLGRRSFLPVPPNEINVEGTAF
jgi:hypothetical protein